MIIAIKENNRVIVGYTNADELTKLSEEDYIHEENTPMAFTADGNFVAFSSLCSASDMLISDDNFWHWKYPLRQLSMQLSLISNNV